MEMGHVVPRNRELVKQIKALRSDQRGIAAIEFAVFAGMISIGMLNVTDIAVYVYQRMQVEYATQAAAQAAWHTCPLTQLPATNNCSGLNTAVQNAVKSTSLGTRITLQSGSPAEGYYCVNSSGTLQYMNDVNHKPADCSAAGSAGVAPADYIRISTTFAYAPMFPGITVTGAFTTPITRTAMMRLG
jgi:Flp pilus assembly protein TadG